MRLTDDELRDVLARAEEIQRTSRHGHEMHAELEAVIGAAEEVGLTRPAVERVLRERLNLSTTLPAPGTLAFASSADRNANLSEVLSISADSARVRFLRGSARLVTPDQRRPCSLIPGARVVCNWPWWGAMDVHRRGLRRVEPVCRAQRRLGKHAHVFARDGYGLPLRATLGGHGRPGGAVCCF